MAITNNPIPHIDLESPEILTDYSDPKIANISAQFPKFDDVTYISDGIETPIQVQFCNRNTLKVKFLFQTCINENFKNKKITKWIETLSGDDLEHFSPEFLETWDETQVNRISNTTIKKLNFEQLLAIVKKIKWEKFFLNLKGIESNFNEDQIKTLLIKTPKENLRAIAARLAECSERDIQYFSRLSSVTIFFFLRFLSRKSAMPILEEFSVRRTDKLASEITNDSDLKRFCHSLPPINYQKILNNFPIEKITVLIEFFQKIDDEDRLFLTITGISNNDFHHIIEEIDLFMLEEIKPLLNQEKQKIINSHLKKLETNQDNN